MRRWWPVAAAVATIAVSVAWVHVFPHVAPEGKWTQQDLVQQRNHAQQNPGASGNAGSLDEPSLHSHWISLREGARTVVHHPQGYGLGNAGQTASRTGTPIKAGESNYTEIGAETGLLGGAALDRLGAGAARGARRDGAAHTLVGRGRDRSRVRRCARPCRPDGCDRRSVDGVLPVGAGRNRASRRYRWREMAIDPRVDIGHVHLKVSDLERAIAVLP